DAYATTFTGGVYVAATDLNGDGKAEIVTGAGATGGPHVKVFDGVTNNLLTEFMAYDASFFGGVRVGAYSLDANGRAGIVTAPGSASATLDVHVYTNQTGTPTNVISTTSVDFHGGASVATSGLPSALTQLSGGALGNLFDITVPTSGQTLLTVHLDPLNV